MGFGHGAWGDALHSRVDREIWWYGTDRFYPLSSPFVRSRLKYQNFKLSLSLNFKLNLNLNLNLNIDVDTIGTVRDWFGKFICQSSQLIILLISAFVICLLACLQTPVLCLPPSRPLNARVSGLYSSVEPLMCEWTLK